MALPGQGLSLPRQVEGVWVESAPLPGGGAERKAQLSVEQAAPSSGVFSPSSSDRLAPWHSCQVSKPFWCSQVKFSSTSHHHKLPTLLYRQTLPSPSNCFAPDQGWELQCWHWHLQHTSSPQWEVNCWCLQGSSSHLWFAPSGKVNPRSWDPPPALKKLMAESHLWGSPRDPELVSFLQTLVSPAWC